MKKNIKLVNKLCPPVGLCPAVYESDANNYLVIGKVVRVDEYQDLKDKIGGDETVVCIPKDLLNIKKN